MSKGISKWKKRLAVGVLFVMITSIIAPIRVNAADRNKIAVEDSTNQSKTALKAEELANVLLSQYGATSVEYALMDQGEVILSSSAGYADVKKKKVPVSTTIYGIGSVSKVYTTVAVMQLVEQGLVDLDLPVVTYIPDFKMEDERYLDITVRMLLNHSSGLSGSTFYNTMLLGDIDRTTSDSFLELLSHQTLKSNPGEISVYCNDGFSLAELLVERVSGLSFTNYLHRNILKPLKVKNTYTSAENFLASQTAKIYNSKGKELPKEILGCIGAGGIYSTAEEMCTFGKAFTNLGADLLTDQSKDAMANKEYLNGVWYDDPDGILNFGLGWDNVRLPKFELYGIKALEKGGDTQFYHSDLIVLPEKNLTVAVMSVDGSSAYNKLVGEEILLTYLEETGKIVRLEPKRDSAADQTITNGNMPVNYKEYAGLYGSNATMLRIEFTNGKINYTDLLMNRTTELTYQANGWFQSKNGGQFRFVEGKNGKTYLYVKEYCEMKGLASYMQGCFYAEKLSEEAVEQDVIDAWKNRSGDVYLLVSEKYSSIGYIDALPMFQVPNKSLIIADRYLMILEMIDKNTLMLKYQIPQLYSRDSIRLTYTEENGVKYIKENGIVYESMDAVRPLTEDKKFTITIPKSGYNKYYSIPSSLKDKKITVNVPKDACFIVYNMLGIQVCNSYLDHIKTATLPAGGYIVFIGNPNAEFKVSVK